MTAWHRTCARWARLGTFLWANKRRGLISLRRGGASILVRL